MVTQERLKELFDYENGGFIRRSTGLRVKCSSVKGHRYLRLYVDGKPRSLHRMIYTWHHGAPEGNIDHADGNRENNRIENLRMATQQENCLNRKHRSTSKSPYKNVYLQSPTKNAEWKRNWVVSINVNGKRKYIGSFEDLELADLVATEARDKFHGQFARHF
jgi:hypothetical protein